MIESIESVDIIKVVDIAKLKEDTLYYVSSTQEYLLFQDSEWKHLKYRQLVQILRR